MAPNRPLQRTASPPAELNSLGSSLRGTMNQQEYEQQFAGIVPPGDERTLKADRALSLALDIRKFEIELYWKRATYFWTFIGAVLAGYALVYQTSKSNNSWLLLVFSSLGLLFSIAWYLVNRGSKFWQNNWERHVDLLEDQVVGPLYKTIAESVGSKNLLTAPPSVTIDVRPLKLPNLRGG